MRLFSAKNKNADGCATAQAALADTSRHPFSVIDTYMPLNDTQLELYSSLREAVPVIDAAISKLVRLIGTFKINCDNADAQSAVDYFIENVKVNATSRGFLSFLYSYFDQLLTYGTAVGEIVMTKGSTDIYALYNASLKNIELKQGDNALDVKICARGISGESTPVQNQNLICLSALNPDPSKVYGNSIMKGLPFVSSVLLKIFNTIGVNFERVGNIRFAVTYKPTDNSHIQPKQRAQEIAAEWSSAMRDKSRVCDFVSVGDVSVKVIGADNQILSCDIEIRHLLEQIVSKLCIPPFLLGLSWSSTERMSSQQADILTSELEYFRTILSPVIRKICSCYLNIHGLPSSFDIEWSNINLQDEVELAKARLNNAQALQIESAIAEVKN